MNKSIFAAAMIFTATSLALTSCNKSPADQEMVLIGELISIMENTTDENVPSMLKKLDALDSKVSEALAAQNTLNKEDIPLAQQAERRKALARYVRVGMKLDMLGSNSAREVAIKAAHIIDKFVERY